MIRLPLLAALLLLGACGARQSAPAAPENPEIAACRAEARDIPLSRDIRARLMTTHPAGRAAIEAELAEAEQRAFNDCLRRRGIRRGGGVEPVRRQGLF